MVFVLQTCGYSSLPFLHFVDLSWGAVPFTDRATSQCNINKAYTSADYEKPETPGLTRSRFSSPPLRDGSVVGTAGGRRCTPICRRRSCWETTFSPPSGPGTPISRLRWRGRGGEVADPHPTITGRTLDQNHFARDRRATGDPTHPPNSRPPSHHCGQNCGPVSSKYPPIGKAGPHERPHTRWADATAGTFPPGTD